MPTVDVPPERMERWVDNFADRHGGVALTVGDGVLSGSAPDGSSFQARLPLDRTYAGAPTAAAFATAAPPPDDWGVLLVRKGGFAVALMHGDSLADHKVGRRHVQGRTKAGGQSQQRFARRRDKQAREAFEAAAEHAARVLAAAGQDEPGVPLVIGGDRRAVTEVLADPRLTRFQVTGPWLSVPDPRRAVLDAAIRTASAVRISVVNASPEGHVVLTPGPALG